MSDLYSSAESALIATPIAYRKPLPKIDVWNKPFWDACARGVLVAQRDSDGHVWFPPSPMSPINHSSDWTWTALSGLGTVLSWVVFHQKYFAGFDDEAPYNVAIVQLDEGPLIYTNLVDLGTSAIGIGQRVSVRFLDMDGNSKLPVFAPANEDISKEST